MKTAFTRAAKFFGLVATSLLSPSGKVIATVIPIATIATVVSLATVTQDQNPPSKQNSVTSHHSALVHTSDENIIGASDLSVPQETTPVVLPNIQIQGQVPQTYTSNDSSGSTSQGANVQTGSRLASGLRNTSNPSAPPSPTSPAGPSGRKPPTPGQQPPTIPTPQARPPQAETCGAGVLTTKGNSVPSCTPETTQQQPSDKQDPNEPIAAGQGENPTQLTALAGPPAAPSRHLLPYSIGPGQPEAHSTPPGLSPVAIPGFPVTSGKPDLYPEAAGPGQPEVDPVRQPDLLEQLVDDFPLNPIVGPSTPNDEPIVMASSLDTPTGLQNASIPEPGTLVLLGGGLLGLGWLRRKIK